jgi:hypothetical protein
MKQKMIFLALTLLVLSTASVNAQVRIGGDSDPNESAVLDLNATNAINNGTLGLALPRVELISTTGSAPLKAHVAGMTVYNTVVAGTGDAFVTPGIYTNNGGYWIRMADVVISGTPEITTQPASFTFSRLQDVDGDPTGPVSFSTTLNVVASGSNLKYQWYQKPKNVSGPGTLISGATTASYTVDISSPGLENWGLYSYYCKISNGQGIVYSNIAEIALGCGAKTVNGGWSSFMCYNLGADSNLSMDEQMAYATAVKTDATVLGDLYQWGRKTDGHEKRTSDRTTTLATNVEATVPAEVIGKFIAEGHTAHWLTGISDVDLWKSATKTPNDPCPEGWRIPGSKKIYDLVTGIDLHSYLNGTYANTFTWNSVGTPGVKFSTQGSTTLFLPAGGRRNHSTGAIEVVGDNCEYYVAQGDEIWKGLFVFTKERVRTWASIWATQASSVRCIAE